MSARLCMEVCAWKKASVREAILAIVAPGIGSVDVDYSAIHKLVDAAFRRARGKEEKRQLRLKLTARELRAFRCTRQGVREIFTSLILNLTDEDADRWSDLVEGWFSTLCENPMWKLVVHVHVCNARGQGKSSAYPLALHLCLFGYPPPSQLQNNPELETLLNRVDLKPEWTSDCPVTPKDAYGNLFCQYGRVNFPSLILPLTHAFL